MSLFEARVGQGRLLACSVDLETDLDQRPVVRQLRASLLTHLAGASFAPETTLTPADLRQLVRDSGQREAPNRR